MCYALGFFSARVFARGSSPETDSKLSEFACCWSAFDVGRNHMLFNACLVQAARESSSLPPSTSALRLAAKGPSLNCHFILYEFFDQYDNYLSPS